MTTSPSQESVLLISYTNHGKVFLVSNLNLPCCSAYLFYLYLIPLFTATFYSFENCWFANKAMADRGGTVRYSPHADRMTEEEKKRTSRIQARAPPIHIRSLYL